MPHACPAAPGLSLQVSLPAANAWAAAADATGAHRCIWLTCLGLAALVRYSITHFTHFGAATALVLLTELFSAPICVLVDATVTALATHVSVPADLPAALSSLLWASCQQVMLEAVEASCIWGNIDSTDHTYEFPATLQKSTV